MKDIGMCSYSKPGKMGMVTEKVRVDKMGKE